MRWDELPRSDNIEDRRGENGYDAFTHGTSEKCKRWFTTELKAGIIEACDTLNPAQL